MKMKSEKTKVISKALEMGVIEDENYGLHDGMSSVACGVKRCLDVVGSLLGLLVSLPIFAVVGWLIKREDGGPVIFKQERIGYGGKPFTLYKFRSMTTTSEADGTPRLCQKSDKRLTKVGRFLREHHLDELPQLWNVLKGEMSFELRPGLFSPATLYNGYTDTMEKMLERLRMDLKYMRERSLWLDFKIIFLTVFSILSGKKI